MENYKIIIHRVGESEDELQHHGIKGMRWGVRRYQNADGTLTEKGKHRYSNTWKEEWRDTRYDDNPADVFKKSGLKGDNFDRIRKDMRLSKDAINSNAKEMRKCAQEAKELLKGLEESSENSDKYASIAGIANGLLGGYMDTKMDHVAQTAWFYAYEDGDQGLINSRSVYVREKNLLDKANDIVSRNQTAQTNYDKECEEQVRNILGVYGNQKVSALGSSTVTSSIAAHIKNYNMNDLDKDTKYSMYDLNEACEWPRESEGVNTAVKRATDIVNKMDCSKGNIWNMYEAVENLGLSNVDMDDMTDKQWNALNEEMRRLNKGGAYR